MIAAMQEEMHAIVSHLSDPKTLDHTGFTAVSGVVEDKTVCVILSGVGKINAAITTTYFLMTYDVKHVINVGSAGGLLESQHVGDVVVSTKVLSHDFDIGPTTSIDMRFQYHADKALIQNVNEVLDMQNKTHYIGLIVSGDQFVTNDSYAYHRIKDLYSEAICVEMEATAVGATCSRFNVPFVVIRALSDVPFYKNNEETFEQYLVHASESSARICIETIRKARV